MTSPSPKHSPLQPLQPLPSPPSPSSLKLPPLLFPPPRLPLSRAFLLPLLSALFLILFFTLPSSRNRSPFPHLSPLAPPSLFPPAPPLSALFPLRKHTAFAQRQRRHSWLRPLSILVYLRSARVPLFPSLSPNPVSVSSSAASAALAPNLSTEIFVYTTGTALPAYGRQFQLVGCALLGEVYALRYRELETAVCVVPVLVPARARVSVVLRKDNALRNALRGETHLEKGVAVSLQKGTDLMPVPRKWNLQLGDDSLDKEQLMVVRSQSAGTVEEVVKEDMGVVEGRHEVCMGTMVKMYGNLLKDWVEYHRRIGVDMVYVMDNDSEDDLEGMLGGRDDVEVVYWPWGWSQVQAWSWMVVVMRRRCEWLLMADVDEYVMVGLGEGNKEAGGEVLRKVLGRMRALDIDQLVLQFIVMGNDGYVQRPDNPLPEAYVHYMHANGTNAKSILRMDADWIASKIHFGSGKGGNLKTFWERNSSMFPREVHDMPRMVHYQFRSWEEWRLKHLMGSGNVYDGHGITGVDLGDNPGGYIDVDESKKYTHFRDLWTAVMAAKWDGGQNVVRKTANERCVTRRHRDGTFGEEHCNKAEDDVGMQTEDGNT